MPGSLAQNGALTEPTSFAPLYTDSIFTGLWTNRNPMRDAATPFRYRNFASRQDSILGGLNMELSSKLSLWRRPGTTVYNDQTFPAIDRFYGFRKFSVNAESIRVIADTVNVVYDATGPSTKTAIWTKLAGAGRTSFQSVGNTLYFGDGVSQKKWINSVASWSAVALIQAGTIIVDSNDNIQVAFGAVSAQIASVTISNAAHPIGHPVTRSNVFFQFVGGVNPFPSGQAVTFSGLTVEPMFNGTTHDDGINFGGTTLEIQIPVVPPLATTAETGEVFTSGGGSTTGTTGTTQPTWATTAGQVTIDGTVTWVCKGSSVQDWGIAAPTTAPTVNAGDRANPYESWQASTFYSAVPYILPPTGTGVSIQQITTAGITAGAVPAYSNVPGTVTANGAANYTCIAYIPAFAAVGDGSWAASTSVAIGYVIAVFTTTGAYIMECVQAGTTGTTQPTWPTTFGTLKIDGTAMWAVRGRPAFNPPTSTNTSLANQIVDSNGNFQSVGDDPSLGAYGTSDAAAPTWSTMLGAITEDNPGGLPIFWSNTGPFAPAATSPQIYGYAFKSSVSGHISSVSPKSLPYLVNVDSEAIVQGYGSDDPQVDIIVQYRTAKGGSTLLEYDEIPAPAGGSAALWTYVDTSTDDDLNTENQASFTNNPPPVGAVAPIYHMSRIWVAVNNTIFYSDFPGDNVGSPVSSFPPLNNFVVPSRVIRFWACSLGLIVFTVSDTYIITGSGQAGDNFVIQSYVPGLGMLSYDAFGVNGTTIYLLTTSYQLIALDPSSGVTEIGFPIADLIAAQYDPATAYLTYHSQTSGENALYAADGLTGWYRMAPVMAPENGLAWSPFAAITGGCQAVKSIEVLPGVKRLLLGPAAGPGPILQRDLASRTDNGTPYACYTDLGSIVLAQPGQIAGLSFITLESMRVGSRASMGILLGEISGRFERIRRSRQDPPLLPPAKTLYNDRYNVLQTKFPVWCRHFIMRLSWPAEDAATELLTFTIFGELRNEFRSQ